MKTELPEYRKMRCCMCPNINSKNMICPGIKNTPHPEPSECRFVKIYTDSRGWIYFVRPGIGESNYKGFYAKNDEDYKSRHRQQGMRAMERRKNFDEAQEDQNAYAEKKGWEELDA